MSLNLFIPKVWSARILQNLHKALVYGQGTVINRDYEGEISQFGDTVHINNIGAVTVFDYVKNTDMPAPETLTDAQRSLLIDQSKAFNFAVDDIDKAQQKPKVMDETMREAGFALGDRHDQFIAGHYTDAAAANLIGTDAAPIAVTAADAYDHLVDLRTLLNEANVPMSGRWTVVPAWFTGLLLKDERFIDASKSGDTGALRNGIVGRAAGFEILESNNVPFFDGDETTTFDNYKIIAGHRIAWSAADQINSVEGYRPERRFGDAVKGLHLYGAKVVRPTALAVLSAKRP